jgi:adenylate kinase
MDKGFDLKKKLRHAVIIILGAPGSGKGTQSALLADKLSFYHIETSKLLEEAFKEAKPGEFVKAEGQDYFLADEKKSWENGLLCSIPFVFYLVKKRVEELHKEGENLILSASPRTVQEAERFVPLLKNLYGAQNIRVLVLNIKPEETIFRNSHRRICELMRHPMVYSKDSINLKYCPLDGSKLLKRKRLDDPKSILVRLQEYKNRTLPLVEYFKNEKISVKTLNGSLSPSEVFNNILKALS